MDINRRNGYDDGRNECWTNGLRNREGERSEKGVER